jgi:hypothetical protein
MAMHDVHLDMVVYRLWLLRTGLLREPQRLCAATGQLWCGQLVWRGSPRLPENVGMEGARNKLKLAQIARTPRPVGGARKCGPRWARASRVGHRVMR